MLNFNAIIFSIAFGVLLPAYKSYKALKYRNVKNMVGPLKFFDNYFARPSLTTSLLIHPHLSKRETVFFLVFVIPEHRTLMRHSYGQLKQDTVQSCNSGRKGQDLIANHINQRSYSMDDLWRDRRPIDRLAAGDSAQESMTRKSKCEYLMINFCSHCYWKLFRY
ncbi:unnamed protein product [Schistocephalus solidus]|uniref:Secreted protein n=1 Tax=Schistocephalus solidus TaxID=70667 RepID=A0A183SRG3_SCHSO|nr:unnamed protein product [Schistocephalus solidus]